MIINLRNRLFLDKKPIKFRINDELTKESIKSSSFVEIKTEDKEILRQYRNFQATCQPAFFLAKFKQSSEQKRFDFFSKAFYCVRICQEQQKNYEELYEKFENVKSSIEEFLGKKIIHFPTKLYFILQWTFLIVVKS